MIAIIDYGIGNLKAFANVYKRLDVPYCIADSISKLARARKIILPGVGSFDWAMQRLNESNLRETLDVLVLEKKVDVLGVCVGMQMMARRSEEGRLPGLGWIDADVVRFDNRSNSDTSLPHMGWNDVVPTASDSLFRDMESPRFYFLHSFYMVPDKMENVLSRTSYGVSFTSAIRDENIYGTQFHPEKSHSWGVQLLQNFAEY